MFSTCTESPFYDLVIVNRHTGQACLSTCHCLICTRTVSVLLDKQKKEINCCECTVTNECDSDEYFKIVIHSELLPLTVREYSLVIFCSMNQSVTVKMSSSGNWPYFTVILCVQNISTVMLPDLLKCPIFTSENCNENSITVIWI